MPKLLNQSTPLAKMQAAEARVSTLLTTVGRVAVAGDHRERRAVARLAAEALERLDEGRLLAADVGAGAEGDDDVEVEALDAGDVLAEQAGGAALLDHVVEVRAQVGVLAAQVDDALAGADGAAGDGHAGEHEVGELGEDDAVLERARLTLVGVADDVLPVALLRSRRSSTSCRWGSRRRRGPSCRSR